MVLSYREPLFRPPSEADSLIIQIAYGCPHNRCIFCPMYKGTKYEIRKIEDLYSDIIYCAQKYPDVSRVFLADGDVFALPFDTLYEIGTILNNNFKKLTRISTYANGSSIYLKTEYELNALRKIKFHTLYIGLESGSQELLNLVHKNENIQNMVGAVNKAQNAGLRACVFALLGLGGKKMTEIHTIKTAEVINLMNPKFLAILRFIQAPGIKMFKDFEPLTEYESVQEIHNIIKNLNLKNTVFRSDHTSIPVPFSARFPKDKEYLLYTLQTLLNSSILDKQGIGKFPNCL